MVDVDLNIANYTLDDLLNLFHLAPDFTEADLKRAKRQVLATHPDKCDLPREHFHFFVAAYNMIKGVYDFRTKSMTANPAHVPAYDVIKDDYNAPNLLPSVQELQEKKRFNQEFNRLFEQHKPANAFYDTGYADWLKSDADMDQGASSVTTEAGLHAAIEAKKRNLKAIMAVQELQELPSGSATFGTELLQSEVESYGSGQLFTNGGLQFEDLRTAHQQSVIPVTQDDYLQRPKYRNVDEMVRDPRYANATRHLPAEQVYKAQLESRQAAATQSAMQRAFELQRQLEQSKAANAKFASAFRHLTL